MDKRVRSFQRKFFQSSREKELPKLVVEHPGRDTFPTSLQICDRSGMVVIIGGTFGFNCDFDVRHLWMHKKRIQGSHYANVLECREFLNLVNQKKIVPTLSRVFEFEQIPYAHQELCTATYSAMPRYLLTRMIPARVAQRYKRIINRNVVSLENIVSRFRRIREY